MYKLCQAILKTKKTPCTFRAKYGDFCGVHKKNLTIRERKPEAIAQLNNHQLNQLTDDKKTELVKLFNERVKNKDINSFIDNDKNHHGKYGHALEKMLGIKHNAQNKPDLLGYEIKTGTNKTSLGDFSASEYLFSNEKRLLEKINGVNIKISKEQFLSYFGQKNPKRNDRYSWSGKCVPKYGIWNDHGQTLLVNDNLDIIIKYSFDRDKRACKDELPDFLKRGEIVIAIWERTKMEKHINQKFNVSGFIFFERKDNFFVKMSIGRSFDFNDFINAIKEGEIIFDSGMYQGNNRNYSQFRDRNNKFFSKLIIEEYV